MNTVARILKLAGISIEMPFFRGTSEIRKPFIDVASNRTGIRATSLLLRVIPQTTFLLVGFGVGFSQYSGTQPPQPAPPAVTYSNQVPTFGAGHDYIQMLDETVNPANGSVSLRLNVPVPKGRGPTPSFSLSYDSAGVWGAVPDDSAPTFGPQGATWGGIIVGTGGTSPGQVSSLGWTELSPSLTASRSYFSNFAGTGTCLYTEGYVFTDAQGQKHAFANVMLDGFEGTDQSLCLSATAYSAPLYPPYTTTFMATEVATSIDFKVKGVFVPGGQITITDSVGTSYVFPPPLYGASSGPCFDVQVQLQGQEEGSVESVEYCDANGTNTVAPSYIEDKNGNQLKLGLLDTLGRAVLNVEQTLTNGNSGLYTATTINVAGTPSPYQVSWGVISYDGGGLNLPLSLIAGPPVSEPPGNPLPYTCVGNNGGSTATGSSGTYQANIPVSLTLPDGTSYQFQYDPGSGLLSKLIYPNGAYVSYVWGSPGGVSDEAVYQWHYGSTSFGQEYTITWTELSCTFRYALPVLLNRYVSFDGTNIAEEQVFSYNTTFGNPDVLQGWVSKTTNVVTKDFFKGTSYSTLYTYQRGLSSPPSVTLGDAATSFLSSGPEAVEASVVVSDVNGNLVSTVNKSSYCGEYAGTIQTVLPTKETAEQDYSYNCYGDLQQLVEKDNYDFGLAARGPLLSKTLINYAQFGPNPIAALASSGTPSFTAPSSMLSFPSSEIEYDGSGNRVAETDYGYDELPVTVVSATSHDDTLYGTNSTAPRANLTSITKRCFRNCEDAKTTMTYDSTGQVLTLTEPNGQATGAITQFFYTDNFLSGTGQPQGSTNAFLTKIIGPKPAVNGIPQISTAQYGFNDSLIYSVTDPNSQTTKFCYWVGGCNGSTKDAFNRLTEKQMPDGGDVKATYVDSGSSPSTTVTTAINTSTLLVQTTIFDAIGHAVQSQTTSDPQGTDFVDTTYDGLGRVASTTNPYRATTDSTYGFTQYTYDALGRKITQTQPGGTDTLQWCYNGVASSAAQSICSKNASSVANASWVDFADENGNHSQQVSDGLGRLVAAMEPDPATNALALETDYTYDALNNLWSVNQKGASGSTAHTRSFSYDSLSRLVTSTNPETGTICYGQWNSGKCANGYDANGNLLYKTDNRNITLGYSYDALNRVLSKTYLNDSFGTASSCYQYDTSSVPGTGGNLVGRLTNSWTQKGSCPLQPALNSSATLTRRSMLSYDPMGRLLSEQQCTFANCKTAAPYNPTYDYDLAGNPIHHSNGIGTLTLTNCYNGAGQLSLVFGVSTSCSSPTGLTLFSAPSYTAAGGLSAATYGTGLNLTRTYDSRLRITGEIDTGNSATNPTPGTAKITITGTDQTH